MAIWKKQNKEASRPNEKESTVNEARDKVSLSDEGLEKAAGGWGERNVYTRKIGDERNVYTPKIGDERK